MCAQSPLNSELNFSRIEQEYLQDKIVVIDQLLAPAVLTELRHWAMDSTIFHETKTSSVGASLSDGFSHPLVLHVTKALQGLQFLAPHRLAGGLC